MSLALNGVPLPYALELELFTNVKSVYDYSMGVLRRSWLMGRIELVEPDYVSVRRVMMRTVQRQMQDIATRLKAWAARARNVVRFRPGGAGYMQARRRFMVNAGQSRATRRYSPY